MSEEAGFSLHAGKDVVTNPTQLKNLYENGLFDPTNLVNAIRENDFGVIVFRAQFYPPPVLDAVYEAYYPAETIPMNGFNYEIWRPGPAQAERAAFADHLETLAPGEEFEQVWTLPFDSARAWVHHVMNYHNWEPSAKAFPPEPGSPCLVWPYAQPPRDAAIALCPAGARTDVTLRRGQ
jgi:hypothetical protein